MKPEFSSSEWSKVGGKLKSTARLKSPLDENRGQRQEYQRFVGYINGWVSLGDATEIPLDPSYGRGEIYGGRWFVAKGTGEVWRLVPPDFPFRGVLEMVDQPR